MQLFLISGMSGSGKSVALKMLEDSGFYCVDNLPADLLPSLIDNLRGSGYSRTAVSIDVRSGNSVQLLPQHIEQLRQRGIDVHLLFLDAQSDTLVKRFSETRRRHPLSDDQLTLTECVQRERELLAGIARIGHRIDTSDLRANALQSWIKDFIRVDRAHLTLLFQSFGFKHGIPLDADLVFDVRVLPNPFYIRELRPLTGRDGPVADYLQAQPEVGEMLGQIDGFIRRWLPAFEDDQRSYLTVAIGCTGGQHRSVYFVEQLAARFAGRVATLRRHRELDERA